MPDNCAICLSSLSAEVYVPCSNHHRFHKHCLMEWATTLHNCPICRQEIQMIRVLKDGKELKVVKPPKLIQKREELDTVIMETPYDTMHCELCQLATDEARMLVCDACDLGFHMNCLRPPLKTVPRGLWECEECRNTRDNFLQSVSPRISPQMEYELNEKEDGEIADSDEKNTLINMFDNEDEHILAEDTNIPSTSRQPTVTMKELREKRIRSKSRRNKTKKSKKSTKRTKLRRKRDSKKKSKHGYSDKDKTYSHVADVCSIKRNDNYQVVRRGGETSYKSAVVSFGRLDLFGRQYIPSLDNEDVDVKQKSYATESTNLELNNSLKHKFTGSISLLDEILANQKVVLAPGKLLKINRDGTIQETEQLRQYIEKRDNTKNETGSVEEYPSRSNSVLLDKFKQIQKSHDGDYQQKLYDATFSVPKSNMNITYKNCKPMSIVNPMIKTKYAQGKFGGVLASSLLAPFISTSLFSIITTNSTEINNSPHKRTRPSRWQSAASSCVPATTALPLGSTVEVHADNPLPSTSHSNNSMFQVSPADDLKGIDFTSSSTVTSGALKPTYPAQALKIGNSASALDFFLYQQSSLSTNPLIQAALPSTSFNNTHGQIHNSSVRNMQADHMTNIIQQLLTGQMIPHNLIASNSIATSSSNTTSTASNLPSLPRLNTSSCPNLNPLNLFFNSGAQLSDLLEKSSSNNISNASNMQNFVQFSNCANINLPAPLLQNIALPPFDKSAVSMGQFINQNMQPPRYNPPFINRPLLPEDGGVGFFAVNGKELNQSLNNPIMMPSECFLSQSFANSKTADEVIPPPLPDTSTHLSQKQTSDVRCGIDSPMDIEDNDEPKTSFNTNKSSENKLASPSITNVKKDRSETTRIADAAMKAALKPYFTKRMISKEEYKELMKKGVAKLRDKNELKPEKVDKFVKRYVDLIAKRRQK